MDPNGQWMIEQWSNGQWPTEASLNGQWMNGQSLNGQSTNGQRIANDMYTMQSPESFVGQETGLVPGDFMDTAGGLSTRGFWIFAQNQIPNLSTPSNLPQFGKTPLNGIPPSGPPQSSAGGLVQGNGLASNGLPNKDRVPIPPVASKIGPMSAKVELPPRPKPGRKPMGEDDAADRRRIQNRLAQRNFRDKRQQRLSDTQNELIERKIEHERKESDSARKMQQLRDERNRWQTAYNEVSAENERLQAQIQDLRKQLQDALTDNDQLRSPLRPDKPGYGRQDSADSALHSSGLSARPRATLGPYSEEALPTPPVDNAFQEIDFTNFHRRAPASSIGSFRPTSSHVSTTTTTVTNNDTYRAENQADEDPCGFCTDTQNCLCRAQMQDEAVSPTSANPPAQSFQPGNCADCQRDPTRAAMCRDIAARAIILPHPATGTFSTNPHAFNSNMQASASRMSCSQFINQISPNAAVRTLPSVAELFAGPVNIYPTPNGQQYEIEEQQAAEALQTLSRRDEMSDN